MSDRIVGAKGTFEPAYWRKKDNRTYIADVQAGPPLGMGIYMDDTGIHFGDHRLGSGEARWIAMRLIEAAAIWETRAHIESEVVYRFNKEGGIG